MSATFVGIAGSPVLLSNLAGGEQVNRFRDRPWLWGKVGIRRGAPSEVQYRLFSRHWFGCFGGVKERKTGKSELEPRRTLTQVPAVTSLGRYLVWNIGDGV
jgi:hypothetical protein